MADPEIIATLHAGWMRRVVVPGVFACAAFVGFAIASGAGDDTLAWNFAAPPGLFALASVLVFWPRRAVLTRESLAVRGLGGRRVLRFDALETFTLDARRYRLYLFVPVGRVAELVLRGGGATVRFHAGFAGFDAFAPIVVDLAIAAVVRRVREAIDRGERAKFGRRLELDARHLHVKGVLWGVESAALDELTIDVADGEMAFASPRGRLGSFPIAATPNLLALPQSVEELAVTKGRPRPSALVEALRWEQQK